MESTNEGGEKWRGRDERQILPPFWQETRIPRSIPSTKGGGAQLIDHNKSRVCVTKMNYQRNSVTGRLGSAPVQTPSTMGATVEGPAIMYSPGTTFPKEQPISKGFYGTIPETLLSKMKLFQQHTGVPIHLKGGPIDKALFGTTLVLCGVGMAGCFKFFYDMSFPKKPE